MDKSVHQWHSIRPWIHRFALSVNQVSSVSATFTLKPALATKPLDPPLDSLFKDEEDDSTCASSTRTDSFTRSRTVSDALAQGLSVKVNSSPWQRVLLRVDEEFDEAIIIVFGLIPGKQYDVELGITHPQEALRSRITTDGPSSDQTSLDPNPNAHDQHTEPVVSNTDPSSDIPKTYPDSAPPSPSSSPAPTTSSTLNGFDSGEVPSSVPTPSMTSEEKIQQLNQTLSLLQSERDSLTASLKTARRDAQRADAAIRADIETLKRASEKFGSVEHRARQKVLALQETVKQTLAAGEDINVSVKDVETSLPALREQQDEAEKESKMAKQEATQAREEREVLEQQEKRHIDGLQTELAGLGSKLEKLNSKREKLENTVIPELEEELRRIEEEIAAAAGPPSPSTEALDAHHPDSAAIGVNNQSGSPSALPGLGGFSEDLHSASQESLCVPIESPRRRKSHPPLIPKHPHPQTQKPVQILRSPYQLHQTRPSLVSNKSTATSSGSTSTLSSLAAPFEPSPKRQAQLQSTLGTPLNSNSITSVLKAELSPTNNVFAPRMGFTTSAASSASISTSTSHKSTGASSNDSTPGRSAWSRMNQKSRRSDVD